MKRMANFTLMIWGIKEVYCLGFNQIEIFPLDGASQDQL